MSAVKPKHQSPSGKRTTNRFWELDVPIPGAIAISIIAMALLCVVVNAFDVPNPNMVLIAGLVICSALMGYAGGVPAAIAMMAYTLFFSANDAPLTLDGINLYDVAVTAIGVAITTVLVSQLRSDIARSYKELDELSAMLEEDNRLLAEVSCVDSLTSVSNRLALRRNFPNYLNKHLHVMMMGIDDFKAINDRYGSAAGDRVLKQIGQQLTDMCDVDHLYRYGGDEFLVVCPYASLPEFQRRSSLLKDHVESLIVEGVDDPIRFSAGYVYGTPETQSDLRLMIRQADLNLYASKNAGKNQVTGCAFSKAVAEKAAARDHGPKSREGMW